MINQGDIIIYTEGIKAQLDKLKSMNLPLPCKWEINWEELDLYSKSEWNEIECYSYLKSHAKSPFIYYFTIDEKHSQLIFDAFEKVSSEIKTLRKSKVYPNHPMPNICHIPKSNKSSSCMYVGSRKENMHLRLKNHLGYGANDTGALHLKYILKDLVFRPNISFNFIELDPFYKDVTEHIESIIYDKLQPFIGKRGIKNSKKQL